MKWTKESNEKIKSLIIDGYTYTYISNLFDLSPNAVRAQCFRLGIKSSDYKKNIKRIFYCLNCKNEFSDNVDRKFCSRSCSTSFNNKYISRKKQKFCLNCNKEIKKGKYCCSECQFKYQYKDYIKKWKNGDIDGNKKPDGVSNYVRKYIFDKYNNKCSKCGWNEINEHTGKIPLQIDHIDGNYLNSGEENLRLLCPNCHSLTGNYGSRNIGNGRKYRQDWRNKKRDVA